MKAPTLDVKMENPLSVTGPNLQTAEKYILVLLVSPIRIDLPIVKSKTSNLHIFACGTKSDPTLASLDGSL